MTSLDIKHFNKEAKPIITQMPTKFLNNLATFLVLSLVAGADLADTDVLAQKAAQHHKTEAISAKKSASPFKKHSKAQKKASAFIVTKTAPTANQAAAQMAQKPPYAHHAEATGKLFSNKDSSHTRAHVPPVKAKALSFLIHAKHVMGSHARKSTKNLIYPSLKGFLMALNLDLQKKVTLEYLAAGLVIYLSKYTSHHTQHSHDAIQT